MRKYERESHHHAYVKLERIFGVGHPTLLNRCGQHASIEALIRPERLSPGVGRFTAEQKNAFVEGAKARIPLGRVVRPEEVAAAALYLAADATFTTGAELFVDGGLIDL